MCDTIEPDLRGAESSAERVAKTAAVGSVHPCLLPRHRASLLFLALVLVAILAILGAIVLLLPRALFPSFFYSHLILEFHMQSRTLTFSNLVHRCLSLSIATAADRISLLIGTYTAHIYTPRPTWCFVTVRDTLTSSDERAQERVFYR